MKNLIKNLFEKYQFGIFIILYCALFCFYVYFDNMPPHWDSGRHIFNTYQINDGVKSFIKYLAKIEIRQNGVVDSFRYILEYYGYYPNGVYYVGICFMAIFGKTIDSLLLSNFVWIILGFASILGISKQLGLTNSQKWLGLLFFFGNPFVIGQMREYQLDFPLLVMMLVATWQAIKFVNKRDFGTSIGLGFAIGFGFLVKWAFLYFVPFLLLILGYSLFVKRTFFQNAFQVICKLALSLVLAWSVIAPWYVHNLSQIYVDLTKNSGQTGIAEGDPQGITWESLAFFVDVINSFYLQAFWLIILVGCALILIKNKVGDNLKLWLVSTAGLNIVFSLLYFMKQGNKDARYPITFLVSFLLIVLIASSVKKAGFINKLLLSSVVLVFSLQLLNAYLPLGNFEIVAKIQDRPIVFVAKEFYTNFRMARQEWAVNKAMDYLKQNQTKFQNCQKSNYWIYKSTITVDLKDMDLHTNYGTIWGMAEEKNWTVEGDPSKSCLTIKGGFDYKNTNSNPLFFEGTNGYSVELINNI